MDEKERKEVKVSIRFNEDISEVYIYGEELFGPVAVKAFVSDIFSRIRSLAQDWLLHPECRHLTTKDNRYRNIIIGNYLIIYRITATRVLVLRVFHAHSSITKIKSARNVKK